jgi:hypothetical protein
MRRLHFTGCDCGQDITLNYIFELGRQRLCREISEIFNPSLDESFKFERLARRILTPYRNAIKLLDLLYGRGGKA